MMMRVWLAYACWCIQWWMTTHRPYYPIWLRIWITDHLPYGNERLHVSWEQVRTWQRFHPGFMLTLQRTPLPWWAGVAALGPFVTPWNRLASLFRRHTGGRSHRCEFTDPRHGALYGHHEGAFMDTLFDTCIERLDGQGLVEYALIIALIAVMLIASLIVLRGQIEGVFTSIGSAL